jgi:hypothetical protein
LSDIITLLSKPAFDKHYLFLFQIFYTYAIMTRLSIAFIFVVAIHSATAWSGVFNVNKALRKAASVASVSAAIAASPLISNAVSGPDFGGSYRDPIHPGCLRNIEVAGAAAKISGTDGNPGCPADGSGRVWNLEGKIDGKSIFVDFSPKGGPKDLTGTWEAEAPGIRFPDGNKWTKN